MTYERSLEELRLMMIENFEYYRDLPKPCHEMINQLARIHVRNRAWEAYTRARESFLKAKAQRMGHKYEPLMVCFV